MELRALKAIFNFAIRWGLIVLNPVREVKQFRTPQKGNTFVQRDRGWNPAEPNSKTAIERLC